MSDDGSVSNWILRLKCGDEDAAQQLWSRYYRRLIGLARSKLRVSKRRTSDEDDIVQRAFNSFFRGARQNRFPRLTDRDDLWRILVVITARKAFDQLRHEQSQRQGGGTVRGHSALLPLGDDEERQGLEAIIGDEPTPEFAAQVAEQYERLLEMLGNETLRKVAVWRMEGYTNEEIAQMLDVSLRTVARKLDSIRALWDKPDR